MFQRAELKYWSACNKPFENICASSLCSLHPTCACISAHRIIQLKSKIINKIQLQKPDIPAQVVPRIAIILFDISTTCPREHLRQVSVCRNIPNFVLNLIFYKMKVSKEVIREIIDELDTGFKCFINIETHEVVSFPDEDRFSDMDPDDWQEFIDKVENNREKYKEIEGPTSRESFSIMEAFVDYIDSKSLKIRLLQALEGRKPFANFKLQIDNSGTYREIWFEFKRNWMNEFVSEKLHNEISDG